MKGEEPAVGGRGARCGGRGALCERRGPHCKAPGVCCDGRGVRGEGPGARYQGRGVRGEGPGARWQGRGALCKRLGARGEGRAVRYEGRGTLCKGRGARGDRSPARGARSAVNGLLPEEAPSAGRENGTAGSVGTAPRAMGPVRDNAARWITPELRGEAPGSGETSAQRRTGTPGPAMGACGLRRSCSSRAEPSSPGIRGGAGGGEATETRSARARPTSELRPTGSGSRSEDDAPCSPRAPSPRPSRPTAEPSEPKPIAEPSESRPTAAPSPP